MRQLEMIVTPDGLRDGLREYLKQHAFANASWPDLIALLDRRTPEDLAAWSRAWVEEAGRPTIATERTEGGGVSFRQQDPIARARAAVGPAPESGARQRQRGRAAGRGAARRAGDRRRAGRRTPPPV